MTKIVEETRRQVSEKDEEIASLKSALKSEMEKRNALEAAKAKASTMQAWLTTILASWFEGQTSVRVWSVD